MTERPLTRRQILERTALAGGSAALFPTLLAGCGGGGDDAAGGSQLVAAVPPPAQAPRQTRTEWKPMRIGAGGYVTGLDIADDGTRVVRCDVYGAYIWDDAASEWKLLLSSTSMPAGEWGHEIGAQEGVYEIAVSPTNSSRIYMAYNGFVFGSTNRGATFTKTSLSKVAMNPNDDFRHMGRRMAVDPSNPDVVYFGTAKHGLWVTADGGSRWDAVNLPYSTTDAGILIAFDRSSITSAGRTSGIYVAIDGKGIYRSVDGGQSFSPVPGSPLSYRHVVVGRDGVLWVTERSQASNNIRRYANGIWSGFNIGSEIWHSIAVDPSDPKHVVAGGPGSLVSTSDGGVKWSSPMFHGYPAGAAKRVANDIPWLAWTNENYMTNGDMQFDPKADNKLVFAQGAGVWTTNPPRVWAPFDWISQSKGIEMLCSTQILVPPGGKPLYLAWDRPVFHIQDPDKFPATHGPSRTHPINMGWAADYAASEPSFVAGLFNWWGKDESSFSTDGGMSWTKFPTIPAELTSGKIGGSIAVASADNIVIVPANNGNPWLTRDRGRSWTQIRIAVVPETGETGWGWAHYLNRRIVTADKSAADTFYLYNYLGSSAGVYRSTNGGLDWAKVKSGQLVPFSTFNAKLQTVPGKAGHLFFTAGWQSDSRPADSKFVRSIDGGATWTDTPNVLEVYTFGFGKAAAGSDYPAIFIAGYVNRTWGIWRSDDNAATWVKIGDYPLGNFCKVTTLSGDMNVHGRCYLGFGASGAAYADLITI